MKLRVSLDWEQLVNDKGEVIAEGHHLSAEDVLFALGYRFEIEGIDEDED